MTSPLPFRWARVTLAVAFVVLSAVIACGRVLTEPRACARVIVDTIWARSNVRPDSFPVLATWCAEWER